jgi:hypothetical protein
LTVERVHACPAQRCVDDCRRLLAEFRLGAKILDDAEGRKRMFQSGIGWNRRRMVRGGRITGQNPSHHLMPEGTAFV